MSDRMDAMVAGKTRYSTGLPCPRGHVGERMVSTRACCVCLLEKKRKWVLENPEKVNAQKRFWRNANIDKVRKQNLDNQKKNREKQNARSLKWYHANREKATAATANWAKSNPDKVAAKSANYRAMKHKQTPSWANFEEIEKVYTLAAKFRRMGCDFHVDHTIPLRGRLVSGLHVHNNLQIIEANANRSKSNRISF